MKSCSIIIPAHNYAEYLGECIESCLNQTVKPEIVLVDDGSTDGTKDIFFKYHLNKNLRYIYQENKGLSAARNTGIKAAKGDRILCLDADDTIERTLVEKCLNIDGVAVMGVRNFGDPGTEAQVLPYHDLSLEAFKQQNRITCCSMFDAKDWWAVGGFDETMKDGREDWDFWLSLLELGTKFISINECLFNYRIHRKEGIRMSERADAKQDTIHAYIRGKHPKIWTK